MQACIQPHPLPGSLWEYAVCAVLTRLHTCAVPELVPAGTLTLKLSWGQSGGGYSVWTHTAMPVARLGQTQQCAWLIRTCVMTCSEHKHTTEIRTRQKSFSQCVVSRYSYGFDMKTEAVLLQWLTSGFALIEDFKVHDTGQPANKELTVQWTWFRCFEDAHSWPVIPVDVIL